MSTPLVSAIVLCHKQSQYLAEATLSLLAQTYQNLEVVIACGDKESSQVARDLVLPRRTILDEHVYGRAEAFNTAVSCASGDYLIRLDADDTLVPTAIEKMVAMADGKDNTIVTSHFQEFGGGSKLYLLGDYSPEAMLHGNYLHCSSLFSRSLWEKTGGYSQALFGHEDWEFWIHCTKEKPTVFKVLEVLMNYRIHGESSSEFCYRNDVSLRAMIRLLHPELYTTSNVTSDLMAIVQCPEEVAEQLRKRAAWFPGDREVQRFASLIDPKVRDVFMPKGQGT